MGKIRRIGTPADHEEEAEHSAYVRQYLNARWRFPDGTVKRFWDTTVGDLDAIDDGTAECLDALPPMPESMKREYTGDDTP